MSYLEFCSAFVLTNQVPAPTPADVPQEEVRRLKVELEASKTRHMQELKAKNDYVRRSHQLRRGEVE